MDKLIAIFFAFRSVVYMGKDKKSLNAEPETISTNNEKQKSPEREK